MRQSAYQAGYRAYNLGLGRCPHSRGSFLSQSWWGGLVGRPARREGRRAQPASPGLRQDVERRPVRHVRRRSCSPRNARPRREQLVT